MNLKNLEKKHATNEMATTKISKPVNLHIYIWNLSGNGYNIKTR